MKTYNVHKRMIAALLSVSVVSGMGIPAFRQSAGLSIEASAADSQMNASKAVGISNINGRRAEVLVGSIFTGEGTVNTDGTYSYSFIDSGQSAGGKAVDVFTKSITLSVSNTPVMLYPIFAGAPREITLSEGIYAEYSYVNAENETVTGTLTSGAEVPNGAVLTLKALNADARIHYEWYINGEMQSANEETISCTVSEDTSVELRTLTAQMDGHSLTLNGPITLNFYVDIKNYDHKALTAKILSAYYDNNQNKEVTAEIGTFEAQDGSPCKYNSGYDEYRFSVPLAAAMINNQITMEVYIEGCETPVCTVLSGNHRGQGEAATGTVRGRILRFPVLRR